MKFKKKIGVSADLRAEQWRIQDFSEVGINPKGGLPTYYLPKSRRKLHEN